MFFDLLGVLLIGIPSVLMLTTALSAPFVIWASLSLGKKVYLPLWLFYAALLAFFVWPREPYYDNERDFVDIEAFLILGALCVFILIIHLLIIRRYAKVIASRKNKKLSRPVQSQEIAKKIALVILGALALLGIYWALTFNWTTSQEFTELSNQEKALGLPIANERSLKDECYWMTSAESATEKVRHCTQSITYVYRDIRLAGQIRDRLVVNGWKEEGYVQHIGSTRLDDPPTISQISQGVIPTPASKSDYFFTEKQGESIKICATITVNAKGDERNPIDPSLVLYMRSC